MILFAVLVVLVLIWFINTGNRFKQLKVKIEEAKSGIDIALSKRYDILTESLNVVKGYSKHESELLVNLTAVRQGMTLDETKKVMANQEEALEKIKMVGEAYPQLYSSELYKNLQNQIEETNEHLSASKRLFNSNVSLYNQRIVSFPGSIVANMGGHHQMPFLEETNQAKKEDVHLTF